MPKIAVVLFNLGGPDEPEAVQPFLFNLFNDPAIIRLPGLMRKPLARFIAARRMPTAAALYARIGGRSPILENTERQARALEAALAGLGDVKCFTAMRYWHPFTGEAVRAVKAFAPDEIVGLPLYPQFSTTTTASSLKEWEKAARAANLAAPFKMICCYPDEPGFVQAIVQSLHAAYAQASDAGKPRILFSAHGLPEKIVRAGDPYPWQCQRTAEAIAGLLGIPGLDWALCYQSRVGPLDWIGPATDHEIERAGRDGVPVVIVPIAFVSEHSETLVEIDIDYRALAKRAGVPAFIYVPTVGAAPLFIDALAGLVRKALQAPQALLSARGARLCPHEFCGCIMPESG